MWAMLLLFVVVPVVLWAMVMDLEEEAQMRKMERALERIRNGEKEE